MNVNMEKLFPQTSKVAWEDEPPEIHLIGNLPFNISLPLLVKWLESICKHQSAWSFGRVPLTLTFQQEVAERMIAEPGNPERSRLSVMCQNYCDVKYNFMIK